MHSLMLQHYAALPDVSHASRVEGSDYDLFVSMSAARHRRSGRRARDKGGRLALYRTQVGSTGGFF